MECKPPRPIELKFEFDKTVVQACNFNLSGEIILYCTTDIDDDCEDDDDGDEYEIDDVRVYSIQPQEPRANCKKIYMLPGKAEVISISKYDKIWLRFDDHIHELGLSNGDSTILSANIKKVLCV